MSEQYAVDVQKEIRLILQTDQALKKLGWKWEPRLWDEVISPLGGRFIYLGIVKAMGGKRSGRFRSSGGTEVKATIDYFTPIVPWEKIEAFLEDTGKYFVRTIKTYINGKVYDYHCHISAREDEPEIETHAKTCQEAVRLAVIGLSKEVKK